jgi:hypothetical protein
VGITDAWTRVQHSMTDESETAHRHSGRYLALCGQRVLAASLTTQERSQCHPCHQADIEQRTVLRGSAGVGDER